MQWLRGADNKGQEVTVEGGERGQDRACKWMEDGEAEPAEKHELHSNQTPARPQQISWSQSLRTLRPWKGVYSFGFAGVVWFCKVEAPLNPSMLLVDVGWRLLFLCFLWIGLGVCVHILKRRLRLGKNPGETPLRIQEEVVMESRNDNYSWRSPMGSPSQNVPLSHALAESLLLCVLQEPLSDPSVPHIKTLLSTMENVMKKKYTWSVSHTLEKVNVGSEVEEERDRDSLLKNKAKLIYDYLQQRMRLLRVLIEMQSKFEASVKGMLEGLDGLWAQLEELHTGVTLTKEGNGGHEDLISAQTDAVTLFSVLGHYKDRLQCCRAHLKDTTQLLQELTWSHSHMSSSVNSSSESVWPEVLLQSNMEQFEKVQDSFLSLEQQTATFQTHLEGLGKEKLKGHAGPLSLPDRTHSHVVSPQTSLHLHYGQTSDVPYKSSSSTKSVSSEDADTETNTNTPLSLRERSAQKISLAVGRLSKYGRRK